MSTSDQVLILIVGILLSIFIALCIVAIIGVIKLISSVKRVVEKAEDVIDSVESAAEVFKDTQGKLAFFKLVKNIIKMVQKRSKK